MKVTVATAALFLFLTPQRVFSAECTVSGQTTEPSPSQAAFQTLDKHKSNLVRADLSAAWSSYSQVSFAPVTYEPSNASHILNPQQVAKVCGAFSAGLQSAFRKEASSGGSILYVRPVITEVRRTNTLANAISFAAFQVIVSYGSVSVRYDLVDGTSGKVVGVITSSRHAAPWNIYPWDLLVNFQSTGQSRIILRSDARKLRRDLDRLFKLKANPRDANSVAD